jgi:hypothetical protein
MKMSPNVACNSHTGQATRGLGIMTFLARDSLNPIPSTTHSLTTSCLLAPERPGVVPGVLQFIHQTVGSDVHPAPEPVRTKMLLEKNLSLAL